MEGQAVVTTCSRASPNHSYLTDLVRYLLQCVLFQKRHGGILNCEWNHAVSCATTLFASSLTCPACNQSLQEPYVSLFDYDLHITFLLTDPRIAVTILCRLTAVHGTRGYCKSNWLLDIPAFSRKVSDHITESCHADGNYRSACQALVLKNAQNRQACTEKQLSNALENELDAGRRKIQGLIIESHRKDRELSCFRDDLEKVN
ncbi:Hypothetical Protein CGB_A3380W [Cryptococcus gattii WM276]|uniref:Uncharacterized protein n=2 Tax=Cryptococcus gattii TaxID=37769 RepID=E6QZN0_CRYGW|nr:Hypothetical Protein CGB_A3380W [Cryptococcus gattii WM276]ADV19548.1 Hypothetical Protein CGB_A3380W [Cryptococcus gattii WM276]KIR79888.1 hypothetical protein I306_03112 [Cryptococcus gattii EJB2]KJE00983.1 hypothetical protein I311_05442 [Cryptococcus gattii NT-10]